MLRKSAFQRSQEFHDKQIDKHILNVGNPESDLLCEYHARVFYLQYHSGKIIPLKERKVLYAHEYNRVYKGIKKEMPCDFSEWQKIVNKYW